MKAHYRTKNGRMTFEVEGALIKDLFERIAELQEIFESEQECGVCGSESTRMVCRENDGMRFHELKCLDCGAQFSFGQKRQGGDLFPRRRDSQGNYLPDHGWYKFEKTKPVNPNSQKSQKCDRAFSEVVWTSKR